MVDGPGRRVQMDQNLTMTNSLGINTHPEVPEILKLTFLMLNVFCPESPILLSKFVNH